MIAEALYTAISQVIEVYPVVGDQDAVPPFAVFTWKQLPDRDKDGINGYDNTISVKVVSEKIDEIIDKTSSIITIVEALKNTTTESTEFESVRLAAEEEIQFIEELSLNVKELVFNIYTNTK